MTRPTDPLAALMAEERARQRAERNGLATPTNLAPYIDWPAFWAQDHADEEWLYEPILPRGRAVVIYARHKIGKSLLTLYIALRLIADPNLVVIYLDYEQSEADLYERLTELGADEHTDLTRLRYALLPSIGPLDANGPGPRAVHAMVDQAHADHPDAHVLVVIDTLGRAVHGPENDADTYRNYWNHTGIGLKRRGCTTLRLDHEGKNPDGGQRGSSSKGDDPDVIWRLTAADNLGLTLTRTASRISWVPDKVNLTRTEEDWPLAYRRTLSTYPPGTKAVADTLDTLGLPVDVTNRAARTALRETGNPTRNDVIAAALRYRRSSPSDKRGTPDQRSPDQSEGTEPEVF